MTDLAGDLGQARVLTVLASASPARLGLLRAAGVDPVVLVSGVDEAAVQAEHADAPPGEVVAALAAAKAAAVVEQLTARTGSGDPARETVVIGADSMLWCDGQLVGKPTDGADARRQWERMAGGRSELLTGHAVVHIDQNGMQRTASGTERTVVRFGRPDEEELTGYLATGEPLQVAGSLAIDGYGGWFVDGLDGDHTSVIGLSLPLTRRLLTELDVRVTDLWRPASSPSTEGVAL